MICIQVTPTIQLRTPTIGDAAALLALVDEDRQNMTTWLPWAATTQTVADEQRFLRYCLGRIAEKQLWLAIIWINNTPAGMIDLHDINDDHAAIGYWLGREFRGHGVITQSVAVLETIVAPDLGLRRLILIAATANRASRAVAKRCDYHLDEILRHYIPTQHGCVDAAVYSKILTD